MKKSPVKRVGGSARRVKPLSARERWIALLEKFSRDADGPRSARVWAPELEKGSRRRIREIQEEKLQAMVPYLYEESGFYRERFRAARLAPSDLRSVADLPKFPIITKDAMAADVSLNRPWGTYIRLRQVWREHGWMVFSTSGTTTTPRSFRYTSLDAKLWASTSARALYAMGVRAGETSPLPAPTTIRTCSSWSLHHALNLMKVAVVRGVPAGAPRGVIDLYRPTILVATPSYALHLAGAMRNAGLDPRQFRRMVICGGEAASGITSTRRRIEAAWDAEMHDVYGCTEAVPAGWAFTCHEGLSAEPVSTHVQEDLQIWELVDPQTMEPVGAGQRGLTVVTNLNSEGSPQLRFLIGDFTSFDTSRCVCGRTFARAVGGFMGRADDMLNIRGLKLFPSAIEEIVRGIEALDDEFQIVLETEGVLDAFTIVAEARALIDEAMSVEITRLLETEVIRKCELRPRVRIEPPGTLPRTEFKARRVIDRRTTL